MSPSDPGFPYHSRYVYRRFGLEPHVCGGDCTCVTAGCTRHWRWENGQPPPLITGDNGWDWDVIDYQLYHFGVYQGPVSGGTKQQRFLGNYDGIVKLVRPLDGTSIFCRWDGQAVADIYDWVKGALGGSTVAATKTLYFLVPDLFIILDRKQVWRKWKAECRGLPILPGSIKDVQGKEYVALLEHVSGKISAAIRGGQGFALDDGPTVAVSTIDDLRLVTPLQLGKSKAIGHTLGKVIDNIIQGRLPGAAAAGPGPTCGPPPSGESE